MLLSVALIVLMALLLGKILKTIHIPPILGMLLTGILLGPFVFDLIDDRILSLSSELRQMALIVILLRAGLALKLEDLKKIGRPALLMSFIPATFELIGVLILGPLLLGLSFLEAAILGSILAAVSPAVVVPRMLHLMQSGYGKKKHIPELILSGASLDDIYVIILFSSFLQSYLTGSISFNLFYQLPLSILFGVGLGLLIGLLSVVFFKRFHMRDTMKVLILFSLSFLLITLEVTLKPWLSISGLLSVMVLGGMIHHMYPELAKRLVGKFEKIWVIAEIMLFVLVGAAVNITVVSDLGIQAIFLVFGALVFRTIGVFVALLKTDLIMKERLFVMIAYLPKATVQAAIGAIPLASGIPSGDLMLSVAVLAIIITAPLGAIGIDLTYSRLLPQEN
jgi:NhaP-type Na+/H+ or K+/H+ antiporter